MSVTADVNEVNCKLQRILFCDTALAGDFPFK